MSKVHVLDPRDGGKFVYFTDPDGTNWAVQEVRDQVGAPLDQPTSRPVVGSTDSPQDRGDT